MSNLALPRPHAPSGLALPGQLARRPSQLSGSTLGHTAAPAVPSASPVGNGVTKLPAASIVPASAVKSEEEDEDDEGAKGRGGGKRKKSIASGSGPGIGLGLGGGGGGGGLDSAIGAGGGGVGAAKEYRYSGEISQMMFVFGEVQDPLLETTKLVEDVVRGQIVEIITRARQLTQLRSSRFLSADDVIFLIRDDRGKVNRLRTYLSWKDVRKKAKDDESGEGGEVEIDDAEKMTAKIRNTMVKLPWELLTPFTDLLKGLPSRQNRADEDEEQDEDEMQAYQDSMQRLRDADEITKKMTKDEYVHYSECRQASFTYRKAKRFREFVNFSAYLDTGPNDDIVDILGFLSFEMVRTLCVKSLEVRDRMERIVTAGSGTTPKKRNTTKVGAGVKRKSISQDGGAVMEKAALTPEGGAGITTSPERADISLPSTSMGSAMKRTKTSNTTGEITSTSAPPTPVSLFAPPPSARQPLLPAHVLEAFAQIQREQVGGRVGGMRNFRGGVMRGRLALV